ncbi:MAG TPA: rhodanese-like domain-containing protein [Gemmatimonadales bacterium]|nr:rhodanese-like domain-containing protein [Gemmatimonadales bacterium]
MTTASLPTPLVSTDWLARHLGEPLLAVVDASWYLQAMNRSARGEYQAGHIPGAVFWDIDELSDRASPLPHMVSPPEDLARGIGALGLGNDDRIVVYDGSGTNLSAARVWWTLRLAGHEAVAVLDGGLKRWTAEGHPLRAGWTAWAPRTFRLRLRPELVRGLPAVRAAMESRSAVLLDARSSGRFAGTEPEPRPGLRGGHIPGARSLPFGELTGPDGTTLPPEELRRRFGASGVDGSRSVIVSCGSGVTACVLALGLERAGHRDYAVYDGSWSEWGRAGGPPVESGPPRA